MTKRTNQLVSSAAADVGRDELPLKKRIKMLADHEANQDESATTGRVLSSLSAAVQHSVDKKSVAEEELSGDSLLQMLPKVLLAFARQNGVNTISDDEDDCSHSMTRKVTQRESLAMPMSIASSPSAKREDESIKTLALKTPRKLLVSQPKRPGVATENNFCITGKPLHSCPPLPSAQHPHVEKLQYIQKTLV